MSRQPRGARAEADYTIDSLLKGLKVLEALEGTRFEAVSIQRVQERTKLSYDTCRRVLLTLKVAGFAAQTPKGWTLGPKFVTLSDRFGDLCVEAMKAP